jgi:hypothetical protein
MTRKILLEHEGRRAILEEAPAPEIELQEVVKHDPELLPIEDFGMAGPGRSDLICPGDACNDPLLTMLHAMGSRRAARFATPSPRKSLETGQDMLQAPGVGAVRMARQAIGGDARLSFCTTLGLGALALVAGARLLAAPEIPDACKLNGWAIVIANEQDSRVRGGALAPPSGRPQAGTLFGEEPLVVAMPATRGSKGGMS